LGARIPSFQRRRHVAPTIKQPCPRRRYGAYLKGIRDYVDVPSIKDDQSWLVENGYIKVSVDVDTVLDSGYVDYAVALDGKR